ncbi:MAG: AEC family transporter [Clostridiales bacterium]|nr:AEC family transporter [Clostridiales bacterium]
MSITLIMFKQLIIMIIYMGIGFILFKKNMLSKNGSKELGTLLLYVILPSAIINSYCVEKNAETVSAFFVSFILSLAALCLAMIVCSVMFRRNKIANFGVSFSNAGFMGIPIVSAVLGKEMVFYVSSFVALLNIFQWTYGVMVFTENKDSIKAKSLSKNPILISMVIGVVLFFSQISLPSIVSTAISSIAALNAPVAMIILGAYLAQADLKTVFNCKELYSQSAVRLILIPVLTGIIMIISSALIQLKHEAYLAILIAASAPVGSNVAIFAEKHGLDYVYAGRLVCLSTLLSVISMPIIVGVFNIV